MADLKSGGISGMKEAIDTWEYKRVVVDVNEDGKSYIYTEKVSNVIKNPGFFHRADIWCTKELPADNNIPGDLALLQNTREPSPGGTVVRELIMYPDSPDNEARIAANKELHQRVKQKHMPTDEDYRRHPSMHRTDSIDYINILKGEMYLMTDTDEVLMKPGDTCVIRGVNHAWSNRSTEPCVTLGLMADAKFFDQCSMQPIVVDEKREDPDNARGSWEYKRIVVGMNAEGKSYTLTQKISSAMKKPGFFHRADLWSTTEVPIDNTIDRDRALDQTRREPFPNGTLCRTLVLYPDSPDLKERVDAMRAVHKEVGQTHMPTEDDYKRHPSMHRTDSLDFGGIARGEIYLMTDLDEVLLRPGDAVIIRGGNHAWSNRGTEPGVVVGGMLDALPRKEFAKG
jgi:mannose-6-phosphate isomerase-like protein (cupin superfamily)